MPEKFLNPIPEVMDGRRFEKIMERTEAFLHGSCADRPLANLYVPKKEVTALPPERREYASHRERWLDVENRAKWDVYWTQCTGYYADSLPAIFPNLGPEIFSACCGAPYDFSETTTWSSPNIIDWEADADSAVFDPENFYYKRTVAYLRALLVEGRGKALTGMTDLHAGGDHLAALRGPDVLCMDLIDHPEQVSEKLASSYGEYFGVYDGFVELMNGLGQEYTTGWIPLAVRGRYNIVQCDLAYMISSKMFVDFFLDGIAEECRQLDRSIFHLDGTGSLRHLDSLLEIKELNAVQWVPGAGNEGFGRWVDVYKRILAAGKGALIYLDIGDLDRLIGEFSPEGIWLGSVSGVADEETAEKVLKRLTEWK